MNDLEARMIALIDLLEARLSVPRPVAAVTLWEFSDDPQDEGGAAEPSLVVVLSDGDCWRWIPGTAWELLAMPVPGTEADARLADPEALLRSTSSQNGAESPSPSLGDHDAPGDAGGDDAEPA